METIPIQVTQDGVLIPRSYFLQDASDYEIEFVNGDILVKPKLSNEPLPDVKERYPWIGMAQSPDSTASERVEEILTAEIDRHAGWTHKSDSNP